MGLAASPFAVAIIIIIINCSYIYMYDLTKPRSKLPQSAMLLTCIREMLCSNLDRGNDHYD
jgi:hypothetical protein